MKSILDKSFRYTSAAATDISKTIKREHKRLAELKSKQDADAIEAKSKTVQLKRAAK